MYNNIKYTLKMCNEILSKYPFVQLKVFKHISNYIFLIIELKLLGVFLKPSLLSYHFLKKNFIFFFVFVDYTFDKGQRMNQNIKNTKEFK